MSERVNGKAKLALGWGGWLTAVPLALLVWNMWTYREARKEGGVRAEEMVTRRIEMAEHELAAVRGEQERRRQYVESIPLLTQRVEQLVNSQAELTKEVRYNSEVMIEMLRAIGFKPPPRTK